MSQQEITEDEKKLIVARLKVLPSDRLISIGSSNKSFSRDELISEVKSGSDIGKKYMEIQMKFLKAFKDGRIYKELFNEG